MPLSALATVLYFDTELDVPEFFVGRCIRAGADVDEFAVLHAPVIWKLLALLFQVGLALLRPPT